MSIFAAMVRTPKDVTDAELAVLEVLWQRGKCPLRAVADELYPGGRASDLATVQKLLERLMAKGFVARERRQRPQLFVAVVDREQLIGRQLQQVADKLCAGSFTPLLSHLVGGRSLTRSEIAALTELLERLDRENKRGRKE
jgi:predicted transcriptional regulator